MPLPKPINDESREEFLDRCMSNDVTNEDFPDDDQRLAVCIGIWDDKKAVEILREIKQTINEK